MVIRAACGGRRGFDTPFRKDGCGAGGDNGVGCDVKAGGRRSDTLWRNWWGTIVSPHETLRRLSEAGLSITSCIAYGLFPLLYSVSLLIAYQQGATPILWRPWVTIIPFERYYLWEAVFLVPLGFQLWITFAAVAHLLAKAQHGEGTYERTAAVFAYTYSVPLVVLMWLPDQLQFLAYGTDIRGALVAVYGSAAGLWVLVLSAMGLRMVHGLTATRSLVTAGAAAALSYAPAGLLLIR
jgi:hypothetical protein